MPFNYSKIGARKAKSNQDDPGESQEHGRSKMWSKAYDKLQHLRWPFAFLLLLSILICQILIFRMQPVLIPIGGELNGLVPHCKLVICEAQLYWLGRLTSESLARAENFPRRRAVRIRPQDHGVSERDQEALE
jgi:hypothetical protein